MQYYEALAQELMRSLDQKIKSPPQEEISAAMRGEMAVLRLLRREEKPLPAGEISRALSMTTSRIAAVLGSLEKKEMILRQADQADKRRVLVTLTEKGDAFCLKRRQEVINHMTEMLEDLGEEDAAHFVRIMKRTNEFMQKRPPFAHETREEESADA